MPVKVQQPRPRAAVVIPPPVFGSGLINNAGIANTTKRSRDRPPTASAAFALLHLQAGRASASWRSPSLPRWSSGLPSPAGAACRSRLAFTSRPTWSRTPPACALAPPHCGRPSPAGRRSKARPSWRRSRFSTQLSQWPCSWRRKTTRVRRVTQLPISMRAGNSSGPNRGSQLAVSADTQWKRT